MKIGKATARYEEWLGARIRIIRRDLAHKHEEMAGGAFPFLRATFYRWAQLFPELLPDVADAPAVLGVGDLHVENFGTWRDAEGRLVWGVNDFDEAARLPYTNDLVRLVTSAVLSLTDARVRLTPRDAADAILEGYRESVAAGGRAIVLAEQHRALRLMATYRLHDVETFWEKLDALPTLRTPVRAEAKRIVQRALPHSTLRYRLVHRVAGLGSLGRERYLALADWHGGHVAREAKSLAPSAWNWATGSKSKSILYSRALSAAVRCDDPFLRVDGGWVVRRLAPDCSRIELGALPGERDEDRLLHAMGWETANVHVGSASLKAVRADLKRRSFHSRRWLADAAESMADAVRRDVKAWRG